MKYAIKTIQNVTEIRSDNRTELPLGGIELTDAEYDALCSGLSILSGKSIIPNPNPPRFP